MKKIAVLLLAASAALSVWAQAPKVVGKLNNVQGLVTVSAGDQLANAVSGAPLIVGNRIIATSSGAVTLAFDNGCNVTLNANQSITVQDSKECAAMVASVNAVGAPVVVAAGGSPLLVPGLLFTGGAVAIIIGSNNKNKTSGS